MPIPQTTLDAIRNNTIGSSLNLSGQNFLASDAQALASALVNNTCLTWLDFSHNQIGSTGAQAIAAALNSSALTYLELDSNSIGVTGTQAIASALQNKNTLLTTLFLESNSIGDNGVIALATALQTNTALTYLNLTLNSISDSAMQVLANALPNNIALTWLVLSVFNDVNAQAFITALQNNYVLTTLEIVSNSASTAHKNTIQTLITRNAAVTQTIQELKANTLTTFNLSSQQINDIGATLLINTMKNNYSLTSFNLSGNTISAGNLDQMNQLIARNIAVASAIQRLTNNTATALDLSSLSINDAGVILIAAPLTRNTSLTSLIFNYNDIGPIGAQALANAIIINHTLTTLKISNNHIGDAGLAFIADALKINSTLTYLELWGNLIGNNGAQALADALTINSSLKTLIINYNNITASGAQALANALKINHSIQNINMDSNSIGDLGAIYFADLLKVNSPLLALSIAGNGISNNGTENLATALQINQHLNSLNLNFNTQISAAGAQAISQALTINKSLTTLGFDSAQLGDAGAIAIATALEKNTILFGLNINNNQISDAGAQALIAELQNNYSLRSFYGLLGNSINATNLAAINLLLARNAQCSTLQCPIIATNQITLHKGEAILLTNNNLQITDVNHNPLFGNFTVDSVENGQFLNLNAQPVVQFSQTQVNNSEIVFLHEGDDAPRYNVTARVGNFSTWSEPANVNFTLTALPSTLALNTALVHIQNNQSNIVDLARQNITNADCVLLAKALRNNTSVVQTLYLQENLISANGAAVIANALRNNTVLNHLELEGNQIGDAGIVAIANILNGTQINYLGLQGNQIGAPGAQALAQALETNSVLTIIILGINPFGDVGMEAFAHMLSVNTALTYFELINNHGSSAGASAIAVALQINKTLNRLRFDGEAIIDDAGAVLLAAALEVHPPFTWISLRYQNIGNTGIRALADMLRINTSITTFYLGYQNQLWDADTQVYLVTALADNYVITFIELDNYPNHAINQTTQNQVAALMARNGAVTGALQALKANTATTLDLSNRQINDIGVTLLVNAMKNNYSLLSCNLTGNTISAVNLNQLNQIITRNNAVANAIQGLTNNTLTTLDLSNLQINDAGVALITAALSRNTSLNTLDLHANQISNSGAIALATLLNSNPILASLSIQDNQIGDSGATAIANALKQNTVLNYLELNSNPITKTAAQAFAEALVVNRALSQLQFSFNTIGDDGVTVLAQALEINHSLGYITFQADNFGNPGLQSIAAMLKVNKGLWGITLSGHSSVPELAGSVGLHAIARALAVNNHLTYFRLDQNHLSETDIAVLCAGLSDNHSITEMYLDGCDIDDTGMQLLAELLKNNPTLQNISLSNNQITDVGAAALIRVLHENYSIVGMNIDGNQISAANRALINNLLTRNQQYPSFVNNRIDVAEGQQSIVLSTNNLQVTDSHNLPISFRVAQENHCSFQNVQNNSVTVFSQDDINQQRIRLVADDRNITFSYALTANNGNVTTPEHLAAISFAYLSQNTTNNYPPILIRNNLLILQDNTVVNASLFYAFDEETDLRQLTFEVANITGGTFNFINGSGPIFSFLQGAVMDQQIQFMDNGQVLTPAFSTRVSDGTLMSPWQTAQVVLALKPVVLNAIEQLRNNTITTLDLSNQNISDIDVQALADVLKTNTSLKSLFLDNNQIGPIGAQALADLLKVNSSLTVLRLYTNQIGDRGAQVLAEALKINRAITTLRIDGNRIADIGALSLAEMIKCNHSISYLGIADNQISDNGVLLLAAALKTNNFLQGIALYSTLMSDVGAEAIADTLHINTSLRSLELGATQIGTNGTRAIANALKINNALQLLHFNFMPQVGNTEVILIAEALKINTALITLCLENDPFGDEGAEALLAALQINYSLLHITCPALINNAINQTILTQIVDLLNRNAQYPSFNNNRLSITEGESILLSSDNLQVIDPHNLPIYFNVTQVNHCFLQNTQNQSVTFFSQDDIIHNRIRLISNGDEEPLSYAVTASDGNFTTPPHVAAVNFTNVNDPPFVVHPLADQTVFPDQNFSIPIPENIFSDPENQTLTFAAQLDNDQNLPDWLNFSNNTVRGIAPNTVSQHRLSIFARDPLNATAQTSFNLAIVAEEKTNTANTLSSSGLLSTGVLIAIIVGVSAMTILLIVGLVLLQRARANKNKVTMNSALTGENVLAMHENPAYHPDRNTRQIIGADETQTNDWDDDRYETGGSQQESWGPVYATSSFLVPAEVVSNTQENFYHIATQSRPGASNVMSERTQAWDGRTYATGNSHSTFWNRDTYDIDGSVSSENPAVAGDASWDASTYVTSPQGGSAMLIPWDNQVYSTTTDNTETTESNALTIH